MSEAGWREEAAAFRLGYFGDAGPDFLKQLFLFSSSSFFGKIFAGAIWLMCDYLKMWQ